MSISIKYFYDYVTKVKITIIGSRKETLLNWIERTELVKRYIFSVLLYKVWISTEYNPRENINPFRFACVNNMSLWFLLQPKKPLSIIIKGTERVSVCHFKVYNIHSSVVCWSIHWLMELWDENKLTIENWTRRTEMALGLS